MSLSRTSLTYAVRNRETVGAPKLPSQSPYHAAIIRTQYSRLTLKIATIAIARSVSFADCLHG